MCANHDEPRPAILRRESSLQTHQIRAFAKNDFGQRLNLAKSLAQRLGYIHRLT